MKFVLPLALALSACVTVPDEPEFTMFPRHFSAEQNVTVVRQDAGRVISDQWLAQVRRADGHLTVLFLDVLSGRPILRLDGDGSDVKVDWLMAVPEQARPTAKPLFQSMHELFAHKFAPGAPYTFEQATGTYEISDISPSDSCRFPALIQLDLKNQPIKLRIETHRVDCELGPAS